MRRVAIASGLVALALGIPCGAWYVAGAREARREADQIRREPTRRAREAARAAAGRLGARLEALRHEEDSRPFLHYQNLYHDPKGAYEGASIVPSPLAEGVADPWVLGYFQIDEKGRTTSPQVNDQVPEANFLDQEQQLANSRFIGNLSSASRRLIDSAQSGQQQESNQTNSPPQVQTPYEGRTGSSDGQQSEWKKQTMEEHAWAQNRSAGEYYRQLKGGGKAGKGESGKGKGKGEQQVTVRTGPFRWSTQEIGAAQALVALRVVEIPEGKVTQGFQVSSGALAGDLKTAGFPARLLPGEAAGPMEAALPIQGASWHVQVDPGSAVPSAEARAREVLARFRRTFAFGALGAGLAGLCVVGLVRQSERLAAQRSQFAASAAHELRTPLAGLRMYGEMLAEGLGDPARYRSYARRVADEAERLGRVVANVLGFSRLERGTLSVKPSPGDFASCVREAAERQKPALEANGATLELAIPEGALAARFDKDAMTQILQNLLDNAEKYSRSSADRILRVEMAVQDGAVLLSVLDRGPGIPERARRKLFRPFSRGTGPDAPAGLGLGLALVRALVEAHGGTLRYADRPGGGSVFTVTFSVGTFLRGGPDALLAP